jgi:hypothetical protein
MSTSGTYRFSSPQSEQIITDAYERIGIIPDALTDQQITTAQRSLNFILTSWINRGLNLWSIGQGMLALVQNQSAYSLPNDCIDILEATNRTSTRNLGGTPFSSAGGVAVNAFDGNPNTACTQNAPNGYISYSWGLARYAIAMVGVQSNVSRTYELNFEYSNDNVNWFTANTFFPEIYVESVIKWNVITTPVSASYFRAREIGGATLDIQELYFNTTVRDTIITRLSRSEYVAIPNKSQTGQPTSFYVDRQINPIVNIWPTPTAQYNNMYFTYTTISQDIGSMTNSPQVPSRFLESLCAALAFMLGVKNPQTVDLNKVQILGALADKEYKFAAEEDTERVPLRIYGDFTQGWSQA